MAQVTFVSSNPGKWREVRAILAREEVAARWRRTVLPEPQADSLEDVVKAKLAATRGIRGPVLVEDSGLFIPSLGGFPGVYSAHFLRIWGFEPMLELLRSRDRGAFFRAVAGVKVGGATHLFTGEVHGTIAEAPAGALGFGYDPIFLPDGWRRTFAEVPPEKKDAISHRGRAIRRAAEFLLKESAGHQKTPHASS